MREDSSVTFTVARDSNGITTQGTSLIKTGGALNPPKYSHTVHVMVADDNRNWIYADQVKKKKNNDTELDDPPPFNKLEGCNVTAPLQTGMLWPSRNF